MALDLVIGAALNAWTLNLGDVARPSYACIVNEQEILRELSRVMDELGALPADAFSERYPLIERQAELRSLLAAAQVEAGRDATEAWADQAARKRPEEAEAFIETHLPDSSGSI